ncbi:MAG: tRNA lysidine(34) synthetase TilS [Deltaproteobacteria bacterium]|jgi:tRNA(Ile)-lysidine synthase|nr:tRNA lysidine(34) synthetase TilS [Deltaproteobacteria bacterium]
MQPLEKEILELIQRENLTRSGEKVLIGVSGGPDSIGLLHVMVQLAPALNITLAAAYVDHGLRPEETEQEKNLVGAAAENFGLDFFTGSIDVRNYAKEQKISIEHGARLLRYDFFKKTAAEWGAARIAVGHTADDQAEEVLLRLIRGTARKGLSGMKTLRDGRIIRPLLRTPKSILLAYLEYNSIRFLQDSSNLENHYLRNRIRNDLLPYLAEHFNPDIRQTLIRTANILQDEEELLENITESAFAEIVSTIPETLMQVEDIKRHQEQSENQELNIKLDRFNSAPRAVQRRLLEKFCWIMGCSPQSRQIEHLLQLAIQNTLGSSLHLSNGLRATINKDRLCFTYPLGRGPFRGNISAEIETEFPEISIPIPGIYELPQLGKKLLVENVAESDTKTGEIFPTGQLLDSALFSFPLVLRGPRSGDRFHPLGAPGSKKISNFLSDQKIERADRGLVPILCADESILALPGLRIDHRYRITEKTTHVIRVSWEDLA